MAFTVSRMREAELDAVDAVVMAAYNVAQSRKASIRLYLDLQPDGAFVVKENETVVGFGAALEYGPFAYIGLMSTHPSMQRRGIGHLLLERLLDWLDRRRCPTVLLDATPIGATLYEQYGFIEDDRTIVLRRTAEALPPSTSYSHASLFQAQGAAALTAFDTPLFGADRGAILAKYLRPWRTFVTHDRRAQLTGYIVAQPHVLGPWVAQEAEDAEQLLQRALICTFESLPDVFVSVQNTDALDLLHRYGFVFQRDLKHMYRGKHIERCRTTAIYGQASLGLG